MVERNAVVVIAVLLIALAALGFAGMLVGGGFGQFVVGMTPGVTAGLAILLLIMTRHGGAA